MTKKILYTTISMLLLVTLALSQAAFAVAQPQLPAPGSAPGAGGLEKVEPLVLQQLKTDGKTGFFIWMASQADLSKADRLPTKQARGRYVFETLKSHAESTQKALRAELDRQGVDYRAFYIANKIFVRSGDQNLLEMVAGRADVAKITANHTFQLQEPFKGPAPEKVTNVEPNLTFLGMEDVWAAGYTGEGTVVAGNDTGLYYQHPALIRQYRGCLNPPDCTSIDHNFNWWDASNTYPDVPNDGHGHGTHTTGTMVGDDGGNNQIGMAPGARTIHCKNMDNGGGGQTAWFEECFEWDLAPWDLDGNNANPDLAPDSINNSWGFWGGGDNSFENEIQALHAAGIMVEVSAGNEGSSCRSLRSPGDYSYVLTTGSINHTSQYPGTLTGFSSRGPSSLYPDDEAIPDIMAPGENIRSSVPGGGYEGGWSGTSMSGPHVTALVGLMWAESPGLRGRIDETIQILWETSEPLTGQNGSNCGGDYDFGPNNDWGYGTINPMAAIQEARRFAGVGWIEGTVTASDTLAPIPWAEVTASADLTNTYQTTVDSNGYYWMEVFTHTYVMTATAFGYLPETVSGIEVFTETTTTQDFSLDLAPVHTVSGTVTDANTGWPLSAMISFPGTPVTPVYTDPGTGVYSVNLPEGVVYTFTAQAQVPGYLPNSILVGPLNGSTTADMALEIDVYACEAPNYVPVYTYFEDFEAGFNNWAMDGLWNEENESDTCGALVAPFPSPVTGAYYGQDNKCDYNTGMRTYGSLTTANPLQIPAAGIGKLTFSSYEATECNGICKSNYDKRVVEVSSDGGAHWSKLGDVGQEQAWYTPSFDLRAYMDSEVLLRFRFDSVDNANNKHFGWMIDNIGVSIGCTTRYGVSLSPASLAKSGSPGSTVNYDLTVMNSSDVTDTLHLSAEDNLWTVSLSEDSFTLGAGESADFQVSVGVPDTGADGDSDVVRIVAVSHSDPNKQAVADLTTTVQGTSYVFLPIINK